VFTLSALYHNDQTAVIRKASPWSDAHMATHNADALLQTGVVRML
jgi:hypothetical protein